MVPNILFGIVDPHKIQIIIRGLFSPKNYFNNKSVSVIIRYFDFQYYLVAVKKLKEDLLDLNSV